MVFSDLKAQVCEQRGRPLPTLKWNCLKKAGKQHQQQQQNRQFHQQLQNHSQKQQNYHQQDHLQHPSQQQ